MLDRCRQGQIFKFEMSRINWTKTPRPPRYFCPSCGDRVSSNAIEKCEKCYRPTAPTIQGNRVVVQNIEMVSNPTVRWNDANFTRYNILDRNRLLNTGVVGSYWGSEVIVSDVVLPTTNPPRP